MTVRTRQQIREAAKLIFRPHFYAYGPWWKRWTVFLVGPREAWEIADVFVDTPPMVAAREGGEDVE